MTRAQRAALLRGIYAIVNEGAATDPVALTRAVLQSGVCIVQYRAKSGIVPAHAHALRDLTRASKALFIINDDWRAVRAYDADGVHLGPEDALPGDIAAIRAALPDALIGISCGTPEEARTAGAGEAADYIGVGAVYATSSKADAGAPIGIEGLRRVAHAARLPAAAIGGITLERVAQVRASGVAMAAVISAIAGDADPGRAAAELVRAWREGDG